MKVLILGAGGLLGRAAQTHLPDLNISVVALSHTELDVTDDSGVGEAIDRHRPNAVLNCAAFTRVDEAEANEAEAFRVNAAGARCVAENCARNGVRVIYPSTDYVFDGRRNTPWKPDDPRSPINAYGRSKAAGEDATRAASDHLVVRTSWLFGGGGSNFVRAIAARLDGEGQVRIVADQTGRPTYAKHLANTIGLLLNQNAEPGIYHAANAGFTTWFEFAREIARQLGSGTDIIPATSDEMKRPAPRPRYSVLDTSKTDRLVGSMPVWRDALAYAIQSHDY